jgi:NAD(P)-dependent dehydrogenase (short-subunit alcohol dehydrogenase family)
LDRLLTIVLRVLTIHHMGGSSAAREPFLRTRPGTVELSRPRSCRSGRPRHEQMSAEDFQAIVDTCFYGVVYTTRAAVPVMRKQKSGHIFQVSSTGGRRAVPGNTPYHAAKWAVGGFSDALAMEVAPFGVKVCTLEPGGIRTNWARRAGQNAPDLLPEYEVSVGSMLKILRGLEGGAEGDPRKIADVIVQLANSDEVPVRLILGVDAEKRVQQAETARAREAEKWRHLTVSTVFEDGRFDSRLYMAKSGINS